MVEHLDDKRYCLTVRFTDSFDASNYSIGDVCRTVILDCLTAGYYRHIGEHWGAIPHEIRWPVGMHGRGGLKAWCIARGKKRLYEIQIEVCEWVISKIPSLPASHFGAMFNPRAGYDSIAQIRGEIKDFASREALVPATFFAGTPRV